MAQYIDKDALVAEIEKRREYNAKERYFGRLVEDNYFLDFINSLEVKEVDLEANIEDYINSHFTEGCDGGMISDWYKVLGGVHYNDLKEIAKHFFELGLKAQKG